MAKATQQVFSFSDDKTETWILDAATPKDTIVAQSGRVGVTITDTLGVNKPAHVVGQFSISGYNRPGVSLEDVDNVPNGKFAVQVAVDGVYEFAGVKVTIAGGVDAPTTTANHTPVYVTSDGSLTLESASNTKVGRVVYPPTYTKAAGKLPIAIGL
ncbi:hypothetical protein BKA24_001729 [Microbacterium marinum]|uniref:Uncharacterized protein n=1 Tax=Microbacterium marinum TaxID=421115 RepID=A0A7W7BQP4_9MICO|nr:hypothetical protein [Microbacterium marinum]MBB4667020.1 hypothetical protein [Microbacterium marinum]